MDTTYFALFWSLLFADAALGGYYEGFLNTKPTSWQNARTSCGKRKPACDLSVQRLDEAPFWESQALALGTEYWVGARALGVLQWQKSKTSLIQAQGCYEATPKGLQGNNKAMGPERCQVKCDGNIIALQDRNCYCLSQAQLSTFTRRPDEECALFCDRESDRCGGTNDTIVSVYKIPDNTVFEKSGQKGLRDWFMMRTSNNQQELLQITNKPHKTFPNKARFCVTLKGVYSVVDIAAQCPKGSRPVGFDSIDVMEFLRATETVQEMTNTRYQLLLSYGKPDQWLDGGEVQGAEEKGDCTSISFDGQGYKLTNRQCKDKLQSVCSCYVKTETTTTTAAPTTTTTTTPAITTTTTTAATTTTTVTTTTTEELSTSTPTSPTTSTTDSTTMETTESTTLATTTPEPATTTTAPPSTTTVTTPPSLSTTESSSTSSTTESTTTESTTETTPPTATPASSSSSSSRSRSTTTTSASNTTTSASRTSSARKLAAASTTTMKNASASASTESPTTTTAAPSTKMSSLTTAATLFSTSSTTESIDMWKTQEGSTLLFPFKAMDDGKGHEHLPNDPAPNPGQSQSGTDGTKNSASASFSVEAIVGITVAAIVVAVILIVAVIVVQRRKNSSGRTLLKDNNTDKTEKKRSSKRETNYPI